jgi:hypothetical protein
MNQFFRDCLQKVLLSVERSELSVESSFEAFAISGKKWPPICFNSGYNEWQREIS